MRRKSKDQLIREKDLKRPSMDFNNVFKLKMDDLFGIVSDTHLCSKYADMDALNEFYDIMNSRGIRQVLHVGDVVDGTHVYPGQFQNLNQWGFKNQAEYVVKNYPKKRNIKNYFIMGNHDARYLEREGADFGDKLAKERPDMVYIGAYYARIKDGIKIDLVHPNGAGAYSKSYKAQRWLDDTPPEYFPNLALFGHWHQTGYIETQGVHSILTGTFQHPNHFTIRYKLAGNIGGWTVEMKKDGNKISKLVPELYSFPIYK